MGYHVACFDAQIKAIYIYIYVPGSGGNHDHWGEGGGWGPGPYIYIIYTSTFQGVVEAPSTDSLLAKKAAAAAAAAAKARHRINKNLTNSSFFTPNSQNQ